MHIKVSPLQWRHDQDRFQGVSKEGRPKQGGTKTKGAKKSWGKKAVQDFELKSCTEFYASGADCVKQSLAWWHILAHLAIPGGLLAAIRPW